MTGEGKNMDLKLHFDPADARARTNLVKDIVALANSGGGELIFGRDEVSTVGLSPDVVKQMDSAKLLDLVEKFVQKGLIHIRHDVQQLEGEKALLTITVEPADYPLVMKKDGTWAGMGGARPLFHRGDIWVRHGSKTERLAQSDMRRFLDDAFQRGLDQVLSAAQIVKRAGPTSSLEFRADTGEVIRAPEDILNLALSRRSLDLPYLLSGEELMWLFTLRDTFRPTADQLEVIIESALRRPPTLYWWLADPRVDHSMMKGILMRVPAAKDRDKSDAASSAVELAAIYLKPAERQQLIQELKGSRYAHFREEAQAFEDRAAMKRYFMDRISRGKIEGRDLEALDLDELEAYANEIANHAFRQPSSSASRRLADITRTIWAKKRGWIA